VRRNRANGWLRAAVLAGVLVMCGCLSEREQAVLSQFPRNRVFLPASVPELPAEKTDYLGEFDRSGTQDICLLVLAPEAALSRRYHAEHDMVLFVVAGSAVVKVEETRYFVEPGAAVLLPRLTAYAVTPHGSQEDFVALMVFTPPFDGEDTVLED